MASPRIAGHSRMSDHSAVCPHWERAKVTIMRRCSGKPIHPMKLPNRETRMDNDVEDIDKRTMGKTVLRRLQLG